MFKTFFLFTLVLGLFMGCPASAPEGDNTTDARPPATDTTTASADTDALPADPAAWAECHQRTNWTAEQLATTLQGRWQLQAQLCGFSGQQSRLEDQVVVNFNADQTFVITQGGRETANGRWRIETPNGTAYPQLLTEPNQEMLSPDLLFCGTDQLKTGGSVAYDGCEYYFARE